MGSLDALGAMTPTVMTRRVSLLKGQWRPGGRLSASDCPLMRYYDRIVWYDRHRVDESRSITRPSMPHEPGELRLAVTDHPEGRRPIQLDPNCSIINQPMLSHCISQTCSFSPDYYSCFNGLKLWGKTITRPLTMPTPHFLYAVPLSVISSYLIIYLIDSRPAQTKLATIVASKDHSTERCCPAPSEP